MPVCLYKNYSDSSECTVCNVPFKLSNTFKRDDYVIYAWNTNPDGTGTSYKLGKEFTEEDLSISLNLYAQWRKPIIPAYRIPIYGNIQCINKTSFSENETSQEFSPIVINGSNELSRDTNGYVVPFKYSTVDTDGNKNSIFTKEYEDGCDWGTEFNCRYHIYDGDLPYIDIKLLCQSDLGYKLPTNMIPYDSISFSNGVVGIDENNSDNSVTAENLTNTLNSLVSYLKSNSEVGDNVFWTTPVKITT